MKSLPDLDTLSRCKHYRRQKTTRQSYDLWEACERADDLDQRQRSKAILDAIRFTVSGDADHLTAWPTDWRMPIDFFFEEVLPAARRASPMAGLDFCHVVQTPDGFRDYHAFCWLAGPTNIAIVPRFGYHDRVPAGRSHFVMALMAAGNCQVILAELDRGTMEHVSRMPSDLHTAEHEPGPHCAHCDCVCGCPFLRDATEVDLRQSVDSLGTAEIVRQLDMLPALKARVKGIESRGRELAEADACGPYYLAQGRSCRSWISEEHALTCLQRAAAVKGKEIDPYKPREMISITDAEKQLGKAKAVRELFEAATEKTPGKPVLARRKEQSK